MTIALRDPSFLHKYGFCEMSKFDFLWMNEGSPALVLNFTDPRLLYEKIKFIYVNAYTHIIKFKYSGALHLRFSEHFLTY
jgi:hypothetical protein